MGKAKPKTCGLCGKIESSNWKRHWNNLHDAQIPFEWDGESDVPMPWCNNWREVVSG